MKNEEIIRETKPKNIAEFLQRLTLKEQEFLWEHIAKIRELDKEEQKPAYKVEPKFKAGDWIVYNDNLYHIGNIALQRYYECLRVDGTVHTFGLDIDSKSHLWTIADAKAGDVLATDTEIYIFKYSNGMNLIEFFCFVPIEGDIRKWNLKENVSYTDIYTEANIHPATKKQRDTLMKAMADAGYTFDFEKKELKKIEQKSWGEKDEKYLKLAIENFQTLGNSFLTSWLKSLKDRVQPKQEWSDEDYVMQRAALEILMASPKTVASTILKESVIVWLQSLKDRVQPKQDSTDRFFEGFKKGEQSVIENYGKYGLYKLTEWSEEDKNRVDQICEDLKCGLINFYANKNVKGLHFDEIIESNIDWLKNKLKYLKPQNKKWKPSKKQMKDLAFVADQNKDNMVGKTMISLYKDLAKLMEE